MYKRIIVLYSVYEEPVCTEQGSAALIYSLCEEPVCTEQGSAVLMYKRIIVLARKYKEQQGSTACNKEVRL